MRARDSLAHTDRFLGSDHLAIANHSGGGGVSFLADTHRAGSVPSDHWGAREDRPEAPSASSDRSTTGGREPGAFCGPKV